MVGITAIISTATEFFFAHSVIICAVLAALLVVSSTIFLVALKKKGRKTLEKKDEPKLDALEKMYLDSLKN